MTLSPSPDYASLKRVNCFDEPAAKPFAEDVNALCWPLGAVSAYRAGRAPERETSHQRLSSALCELRRARQRQVGNGGDVLQFKGRGAPLSKG